MPPRISVFPKCYFDELVDGRMPFDAWIRDAATLGGEGIEHYDGFFRTLPSGDADVDPVVRALDETGQTTSMICFCPTSRTRTRTNARVRWRGRRPRST